MVSLLYSVFWWKNYKYIASEWKIITLQLIGFALILSIYMGATSNNHTLPQMVYDYKDEAQLKSYFTGEEDDFVFYAPSNKFLDELMENVRIELSLSPERLMPFDYINETYLALEERQKSRSVAVLFEMPENEMKPSKRFSYNISAIFNKVSTSKVYLNDEEVVGIKDYDSYIDSGFFILQRTIDKCYINLITHANEDNNNAMVQVAPIPFLGYESIDNTRILTFGIIFSVFFYIFLLSVFLVPLVEEKQDGIKEFFVLTTPYNYMNGVTFYFLRFVIFLGFVLVALVIGAIWNGLGTVSVFYVVILFVLFTFSSMSYGFLISVLFSSVFYAKIGGLILLLMPTALFTFGSTILRVLSYLFCANTFLEGMFVFQKFTNKHREFNFDGLFINITEISFKMFTIFSLLLIQCFVYIILYWYLSHLFPGEGGVKKPYNFMFKSSFYKKLKSYETDEDPLNSDVAVKIRGLTKNIKTGWNKKKVIVDNVSMNIGSKRITVLLGHNGAGKTTTLNMITGCVEKSSGEIRVCNLKEVSIYRHLIGFCPQHNVFMKYLSCSEHLQFFARLRGLDKQEADNIAFSLLKKLRLVEKANETAGKLSGGMKRRLSLGLAISGDTKIIILDEPSSGLDPESRRELWNILLELRKTQTILITTHHMEEAEILGDTIAILSQGKLLHINSTMELKRLYGFGYILKLLTGDCFDLHKTMQLICEIIPEARFKSKVDPTVCITLPYSYREKYSDVLRKLEESALKLGISAISITNTSLEEVFLNCEPKDERDSIDGEFESGIPYKKFDSNAMNPFHQALAVFYKKAIFIKREWVYTLFMLGIPVFNSIIAMFMLNCRHVISDTNSLALTINYLPQAEIYLKIPKNFNALKRQFVDEIQRANIKSNFINENNTLADELLNLQKGGNLSYFYDHVIGAIEVTTSENGFSVNILHSGNIIHSSAILLNLVDNVILKYFTNGERDISTFNVPLQRTAEISPARLEYFNIIMPVGWLFYMIFFITLPFKEEKSEFKKLQFAPTYVYWLACTIFDAILHCIVCICVFWILSLGAEKEVYDTKELLWMMTSFMFYGISYLPILYVLASSFQSMSTLSACFLLLASISSITPLITSANIQAMDKYQHVIVIMSILPDFSLNHQLRLISENHFIMHRNSLSKNHALKAHHSSNFNLTGIQGEPLPTTTFFIYAIVVFVVTEVFLIYFWDNVNRRHAIKNLFQLNWCKRNTTKLHSAVVDETDVSNEKLNVQKIITKNEAANYALVVKNLHKNYDKIHAVRGINFTVNNGECFGLLGINGGGKTSTFRMITANEKISDGEVFIDGVSISKDQNTYKFLFGYCPQTDALNDFMTSYEILKYMALLRDVGLKAVHQEVMFWLTRLDLIKYKDIPIKNYSGGTKRKLNTAIAMIGNRPILFLDEPTTGVDPVSRRFIWKCIQEFQKEKRTIVLTSHSMDECEELCNRLAIMVDGQFKCVGNIPSLKLKFGSGFTLTFHLQTGLVDGILSTIHEKMKLLFDCKLKEEHAGIVTYFIYEKDIVWSKVLKEVEEFFSENKHVLRDYSINEATLEDIFLSFESKQSNYNKMEGIVSNISISQV